MTSCSKRAEKIENHDVKNVKSCNGQKKKNSEIALAIFFNAYPAPSSWILNNSSSRWKKNGLECKKRKKNLRHFRANVIGTITWLLNPPLRLCPNNNRLFFFWNSPLFMIGLLSFRSFSTQKKKKIKRPAAIYKKKSCFFTCFKLVFFFSVVKGCLHVC